MGERKYGHLPVEMRRDLVEFAKTFGDFWDSEAGTLFKGVIRDKVNAYEAEVWNDSPSCREKIMENRAKRMALHLLLEEIDLNIQAGREIFGNSEDDDAV